MSQTAFDSDKRYATIDDPDADAILRSSDSINFHVRKSVLSEVSTFFKDMFSLPQNEPSDDFQSSAGLDIVPVAEDKDELYLFIRLCYPNHDHSLSDLTEVKRALKILRKYDVQRIPDSVGLALMLAVNEHPTTVCAIACGYNFPAVANAAAKASLKFPLFSDASQSDEDLDLMTASQYDKFLRYHKNVATRASTAASSFQWMGQDDPIPTAFRPCKCPHTQIVLPGAWASPVANWVIQWRKEMSDALAITPDFNTVSRRGIATMRATTTAISSGCPSCRTELEKLPALTELIANRVDVVTAQVPLPF